MSYAGGPERIGPFQVVRSLGAGGMGAVYEVIDPQLGRVAALKLLKGRGHGDALERFYREAEVLARLVHPNVVKVHRTGELPAGPWILEERVEGRALDEVLQGGPLPPEQAARIARALADALAAVHAAGVVHRDLKPANVILRADGAPVLIDFGVARDADAETLTRTGALVGTVAYMAPEQVRHESDAPVDGRADLYALGLVLYEMLAGERAYEGAPLEVMARILTEDPPSLRARRPEAPLALEAVLGVCLRRRREERYADAAALREDLDRFLAGQSTHSEERLRVEARARRGRRAGLGLLALLGAGALVALALATRPAPPPTPGPELPARDEVVARAAAALERGDAARAEALLAREPTPRGSARAQLALRAALLRAEALARQGDGAGAAQRLHRARELEPQAAADGLTRAATAALGGGLPPARVVALLETLRAAWPGARLPAAAAGPYAAQAGARLAEGGDAGVVAAAALCALARRWDPAAPLPAGIELAAARAGHAALGDQRPGDAAGRLEQAARLLIASSEAGFADPSSTSEADLRRLSAAGAFARALRDDPAAPVARLWAARGEAIAARELPAGPGRTARAERAADALRALRPELSPALAAVAAGDELRLRAALEPARSEALAAELARDAGAEGWRVARVAAVLLRRTPRAALPWAARALEGARRALPGSGVHADALETRVRLLIEADERAEARAALAAPGARGLLGEELTRELLRRAGASAD
ncbi:MAG: protein kinase [Planctomycetota bacterium]